MRSANILYKTKGLRLRYLNDLKGGDDIPAYKLLEGNFSIDGYMRYNFKKGKEEEFNNIKDKDAKLDFLHNNCYMIGMGGSYKDQDTGDKLNFMFSYQMGWYHLSVSMPDKDPSWVQMCKMKDIFFDDEEECVEYHPKKSEYINVHPHCLHIWRRNPEDSLESYRDLGLITEGETVKFKDLLAKKGIKIDLDSADEICSLEGFNGVSEATFKIYNNVPAELLFSEIRPPYLLAGTKSKAGYGAIREMAEKNGIQIGLGGD